MLILPLNILLAALPTGLLLFYIYRQDTLKPEPVGLVLKVFFLGCLSTIPAIFLELVVDRFKFLVPPVFYLVFDAFIVAALCEETIKLVTVRISAYRKDAFDEIMDGIVYTVAGGLGFAFLENIMYSIGSSQAVVILLLRGVTAVPLHGIASGILGYYIGLTKMTGQNHIPKGLLIAVLIHGTYDLLLFTGNFFLGFGIIPVLVISFIFLKRLIKKARQADKLAGRF